MTHHWRSDEPEDPVSAFFRYRWRKGSVWVLDIDKLICSPDRQRGIAIELKHIEAIDKNWLMTLEIAEGQVALGRQWYAALLEYEHGDEGIIPLFWTVWKWDDQQATRERKPINMELFDKWVATWIAGKH